MTKNELTQLYFLNREIESIKKRIADIRYKVKIVKNFTHDQNVDFNNELTLLTNILIDRQKKCLEEQVRLENFINNVESSEMRIILAYRYVNGLSWQQVAFSIGEHDESYVRKKHNAFLNKLRKQNGGKIKLD